MQEDPSPDAKRRPSRRIKVSPRLHPGMTNKDQQL
jgi:hypothetical protein